MGPAAAEGVQDLVRALDDEIGAVRRASIDALGQVGASASTAIPTLVKALESPGRRMQREAAVAIGLIGVASALKREPDRKAPESSIERAVTEGLDWLCRHQSSSGEWDCAAFSAECDLSACRQPGETSYTPGVSGLALLCYLGFGETHQSGAHKETVGKGLEYPSVVTRRRSSPNVASRFA
jgi:hypothetical protein